MAVMGSRNRTPAPPPFSGIKTTPAFVSALSIKIALLSLIAPPRSKVVIAVTLSLPPSDAIASDKSACFHLRSALPAEHCVGVIISNLNLFQVKC